MVYGKNRQLIDTLPKTGTAKHVKSYMGDKIGGDTVFWHMDLQDMSRELRSILNT